MTILHNKPMILLLSSLLFATTAVGQQNDLAANIYARVAKSVFVILLRSPEGQITTQGTGFLVEGGKIITNEHVIRGGTPFIDLGAARVPAAIEASDALNDIAILTTPAELSVEQLTLADQVPRPGTSVFAIGNPRGLEKSISTGVIAGVRDIEGRQLIQVTTPVSPGSSGGPVLDSSGKVVGIVVGSIEKGQNLNFAVPASVARALLNGDMKLPADVSSLAASGHALIERRDALEFSEETDSPYQRLENQIKATFLTAIKRASKDDLGLLIEISNKFTNTWVYSEADIAVSAAERALSFKSSSDIHLALAKALSCKAMMSESEQEKSPLLERAEGAARQAISLSKRPDADMYYTLGDTLQMRNMNPGADGALRHALDLNRANPNRTLEGLILRDLVSVAVALGHSADVDKWFAAQDQAGHANFLDWESHARRLDAAKRYGEAGAGWQRAATLSKTRWGDWCEAAGSFALASKDSDSALYCARECISAGAGKPGSEGQLSLAHKVVANVLNSRGVYEEGLSHAKEATVLAPDDAWAYKAQAEALLGLRRFQEAVNAAKQAVRASDGKYGIMHFHLGSAYFETENWPFAQQSYAKAAELMPSSDAAAFNTALCFQRMGLLIDAAQWYEEALRRNPGRTDKQDLLRRISALRGR